MRPCAKKGGTAMFHQGFLLYIKLVPPFDKLYFSIGISHQHVSVIIPCFLLVFEGFYPCYEIVSDRNEVFSRSFHA